MPPFSMITAPNVGYEVRVLVVNAEGSSEFSNSTNFRTNESGEMSITK